MPWSDAAGVTHDGWQTLSVWDVFLVITGVSGIAAAITGGRFGFFRPDLSLNGTADILAVIAGILSDGSSFSTFRQVPIGRLGCTWRLLEPLRLRPGRATSASDLCFRGCRTQSAPAHSRRPFTDPVGRAKRRAAPPFAWMRSV